MHKEAFILKVLSNLLSFESSNDTFSIISRNFFGAFSFLKLFQLSRNLKPQFFCDLICALTPYQMNSHFLIDLFYIFPIFTKLLQPNFTISISTAIVKWNKKCKIEKRINSTFYFRFQINEWVWCTKQIWKISSTSSYVRLIMLMTARQTRPAWGLAFSFSFGMCVIGLI